MTLRQLRSAIAIALTVSAAAAGAAQGGSATSQQVQFAEPIRLNPPNIGGFEPGIQVDRFNNIYVTAHKDRHVDLFAPDSDTRYGVRGASYLWTSSDGRRFRNLTPQGEYTTEPRLEGDLALDDADNLYFVDTYLPDSTFSRWSIGGPGEHQLDLHRQMVAPTQGLEDRPWLAAHGNGVVLYTSNVGFKELYPFGRPSGDGAGAGRFTVFMSYDGGRTFDSQGVTLKDSEWCHPAADHRRGSRSFYVACTDSVDNIYAFFSHDDGRTWSRRLVGKAQSAWWPTTAVAPDGTVYFVLPDRIGPQGKQVGVARLFRSSDGGGTWTEQPVPTPGLDVEQTALAIARDGTVAVSVLARDAQRVAHMYASLRRQGRWWQARVSTETTASAKPMNTARGEFFQTAFGPDNKLNIVWAANSTLAPAAAPVTDRCWSCPLVDGHDVYFSRQL